MQPRRSRGHAREIQIFVRICYDLKSKERKGKIESGGNNDDEDKGKVASGTDKRKVARARTEAKITGDQTGIFSANVKSKSRDVISCKGAGTSPICIAGPGQGGEQEALGRGVIYVTYGLYLQSGTTSASTPESDKERSAERKRKLGKRERERDEGRVRETGGSKNERRVSTHGMGANIRELCVCTFTCACLAAEERGRSNGSG